MQGLLSALMSLTVLVFLTACSGGAGSGDALTGGSDAVKDTPDPTAGAISGTAALGAPMANAKVKVEGPAAACNGLNAKSSVANTKGVFSVALEGCEGPYIISAESSAGKVFSVATSDDVGKIVNTTPLTNLVASRVLNTNDMSGLNPSTLNFSKENVSAQVTVVTNIISTMAAAFGASAVDIRSGVFAANGSMLDKVLDAINIQPSGAGMSLSIKGSNATPITVPSSVAAPTGTIDAGAIAEAELAMVEFNAIKTSLMGGINACLKAKDKDCFLGFFHSDYKHNGHVAADEWDDIYWDAMEVIYGGLVLVEMNPAAQNTEAWIAYNVKEKQKDTGLSTDFLDLIKLKKEAGKWKIYGNRIPQLVNLQPSMLKYSDDLIKLARGLRFRSTNWTEDASPDFFVKVKSTDLNISSEVTIDQTDGYITVQGDGNSPCIYKNLICESFLQVADVGQVNFPKVLLAFKGTGAGATYSEFIEVYLPTMPQAPTSLNEVPSFATGNLALDDQLCRHYTGVSDFPSKLQRLSWTLPTGYTFEGFDFASGMTSANLDIDYDDTSATARTEIPFGSVLEASGAFDISTMEIGIETRDSLDRAFFLTYSCPMT